MFFEWEDFSKETVFFTQNLVIKHLTYLYHYRKRKFISDKTLFPIPNTDIEKQCFMTEKQCFTVDTQCFLTFTSYSAWHSWIAVAWRTYSTERHWPVEKTWDRSAHAQICHVQLCLALLNYSDITLYKYHGGYTLSNFLSLSSLLWILSTLRGGGGSLTPMDRLTGDRPSYGQITRDNGLSPGWMVRRC